MFSRCMALFRSFRVIPASTPPAAERITRWLRDASAASSPPTHASAERKTSRSCDSSSLPSRASSNIKNADCKPASCSFVSSRGVQDRWRRCAVAETSVSVSVLAKAEACAKTPPPSSSAASSEDFFWDSIASKSPSPSARAAVAALKHGVQSHTITRFFRRLCELSAQPVLNQLRLTYR